MLLSNQQLNNKLTRGFVSVRMCNSDINISHLRLEFVGPFAGFNENLAAKSLVIFGKQRSTSLRALVFSLTRDLIIFNKCV